MSKDFRGANSSGPEINPCGIPLNMWSDRSNFEKYGLGLQLR